MKYLIIFLFLLRIYQGSFLDWVEKGGPIVKE
jgi:hypothetical protein